MAEFARGVRANLVLFSVIELVNKLKVFSGRAT